MENLKVQFKIENHRLFLVAMKEGDFFILPKYSNETANQVFQHDEIKVHLVLENSENENWIEVSKINKFTSNHGAILLKVISSFYSFMPESSENLIRYIPREFLKAGLREKLLASMVEEITFYGGSFNPWHEGHSECLRQCPAEEILIVPDSNPWKGPKENSECLWQSFKEIAQRFEESRFSLFPGFWILKEINPTVQWLPHVKVAKKNFLMGDDNFFSLRKWTDASDLIASLNQIYVVPRLYKKNQIEEYKNDFCKDFKIQVTILSEHNYQGLSSTEIRNTEGL